MEPWPHAPPLNAGNLRQGGESFVYVGSFREEMADHFNRNNSETGPWAPIRRGDDTEWRIDDLGYALGYTAAHELGHGLGLVAGDGPFAWMWGDREGHPREDTPEPLDHVSSVRNGRGAYLMDPGGYVRGYVRIGEPVGWGRAADSGSPRRLPVFCEFHRSYLLIIQPGMP